MQIRISKTIVFLIVCISIAAPAFSSDVESDGILSGLDGTLWRIGYWPASIGFFQGDIFYCEGGDLGIFCGAANGFYINSPIISYFLLDDIIFGITINPLGTGWTICPKSPDLGGQMTKLKDNWIPDYFY